MDPVEAQPFTGSTGMIKRYPSPLRYPGGKGKIANFMKALVIENELFDHEYIEPYAGGASVALSLLFDDYTPRVQINDLNPGVAAFWRLATTNPDDLCRRIKAAKLTVEEWRSQRQIYQAADTPEEDRGYATFYLNRTNRSGIIERGSVIGGIQQTGQWGIGARFNKAALCGRIQKIASFASRITVTGDDAACLISTITTQNAKKFLYFDPPYYVKGGRLYQDSYAHADHIRIRDALRELRQPWVVSYDAAPEITEMHAEWTRIDYNLGYSAATVGRGSEVMFFSKRLALPRGVFAPTSVTNNQLGQLLSRRRS